MEIFICLLRYGESKSILDNIISKMESEERIRSKNEGIRSK